MTSDACMSHRSFTPLLLRPCTRSPVAPAVMACPSWPAASSAPRSSLRAARCCCILRWLSLLARRHSLSVLCIAKVPALSPSQGISQSLNLSLSTTSTACQHRQARDPPRLGKVSWGPSPRIANTYRVTGSQPQSHKRLVCETPLAPLAYGHAQGQHKAQITATRTSPSCTSIEQLAELKAPACMQANRSGRHSPGQEREERSQTESRLGDQWMRKALHMQHVPSVCENSGPIAATDSRTDALSQGPCAQRGCEQRKTRD